MTDTKTPKYKFPPIQEAVIELVFDRQESFINLQKAAAKLEMRYPLKDSIQFAEANFSGEGKQSFRAGAIGFHLSSLEVSDIVQLLPNRLATSRTAPYEGWDSLLNAARENWRVVSREIGNRVVKRIGIRYINRIDVPLKGQSSVELADYLSFLPNVMPISHEPMTEFTVLVARKTNNPLWSARLISTLVPPALVNHISLLFDIDLYREQQIPVKPKDLWAQVNEVRELKNQLFEGFMTQKTRGLFRG